jgi:hypothetical protein
LGFRFLTSPLPLLIFSLALLLVCSTPNGPIQPPVRPGANFSHS